MRLGAWLVMLTAMILFLTFVGIPTGLSPVLDTIGIEVNQTSLDVVSADIESSTFWDWLFDNSTGILVLLSLGGAVVIGLFAKSYDTSLIILPFIILVAGQFIVTFWAIIKLVITYEQWWMTSIITLIFGALAVGFIMSCVDYFAGR